MTDSLKSGRPASFTEWLFAGILKESEIPDTDPVKQFAHVHHNNIAWPIMASSFEQIQLYLYELMLAKAEAEIRGQARHLLANPPVDNAAGFSTLKDLTLEIIDMSAAAFKAHLFVARTAWHEYTKYVETHSRRPE